MKVIKYIIVLILVFIVYSSNVNSSELQPNSNSIFVNKDIVKGGTTKEKIKVFIVHGRNDNARSKVYELLSKMGFKPVLLYEQANNGDTIIEKLEREVDKCKFGIVIMSPDNVAFTKSGSIYNETLTEVVYPRLNVVFEFGLLIGKYGRENVIYLNVPYNGMPANWDFTDILGYTWVNYTDDLKELENEINVGDYKNKIKTNKTLKK